MKKITIVSIASKNIHKQLSGWCLKAYLEENSSFKANVLETTINDNYYDILGTIMATNPDILGFSCYIWNISLVKKLIKAIKQLDKNVTIILGGPEVSFEEDLSDYPNSDYIIKGEGEKAFCDLVIDITTGNNQLPYLYSVSNPDFSQMPSPYTNDYFSSFSKNQIPFIQNQLVYYESCRGCPFSCSYCLSSVCDKISYVPLERVKSELLLLVENGASCIKFVDRTFNANKKRAYDILSFIKELDTATTFHFEAAADLFDDNLFDIISKMPKGRIQFEIGLQSTNEETLKAINRKTNTKLVLENIKKLVEFNNCHVHADLIAGLELEDYDSFLNSIDECIKARPHMLQLGFLKLLKGSQIRRFYSRHDYVFQDFAPYEILQNKYISFNEIIYLKRIEKVLDKFYNSQMFLSTYEFAVKKVFSSDIEFLVKLSDYILPKDYKTTMKNAYTLIYNFLKLHYNNIEEIKHHIKIDCLTFCGGRYLPDDITLNNNRALEISYKQETKRKHDDFTISYFSYDDTTRIFLYDKKDELSKQFFNEIYIDTLKNK